MGISVQKQVKKLISYLGARTLFRGGPRVFFIGWAAPLADVPAPAA
jgi:hypothetical protein